MGVLQSQVETQSWLTIISASDARSSLRFLREDAGPALPATKTKSPARGAGLLIDPSGIF
jgi:hypothetical protein